MAVRRGKGLEMANRILEENKKRGPFYNAEMERSENIIGKRIQEVRKEKGVSLEGLSYVLRQYGIDMKQNGIGRWESGTVIPNAYQLMALSHIFNIEDPDDVAAAHHDISSQMQVHPFPLFPKIVRS